MLRIGILINDFESLENWELRIIEGIRKNPNLELVLVIKVEKEVGQFIQKDQKNNYINISNIANCIATYLFEKQTTFETKRYVKSYNQTQSYDSLEAIKDILIIGPKNNQNNPVDELNSNALMLIKSLNLDLICQFNFMNFIPDLLGISKYGNWILSFSDISLLRGGPAGFWEILLKKSSVRVLLLQLKDINQNAFVIDEAHYNRHGHSYVETKHKIEESATSLLFKNLRRINSDIEIKALEIVNINRNLNFPMVISSIKYISNFYRHLATGLTNKLFLSIGKRAKCWTLFIGQGNFMDTDLSLLKPIKLPKDEFWADPFLFNFKTQLYVFFENFSYTTKRGKISCGKVIDDEVLDVIDVLDLPYHLSYPFIFEEEGEIYMMPETSQNKRLEIYKCTMFPNQWELYKTAFNGDIVVDSSFYVDKEGKKWLFLNKMEANHDFFFNELYIYQVDSIHLNILKSHKQNPVLIDSRSARNGGKIFTYNDEIYRPSQCSIDGIYGKALNLNKIKKLTLETYEEEIVKTVEPSFYNNLVATHHLHQIDGMFVIDGALKYI